MEAGSTSVFRVIGVLGGVGSGKSFAAIQLAELLNGVHLDADEAVSALLEQPETLSALEFALDANLKTESGKLDRVKLGERIFQDESARRDVESILHPGVRRSLHNGLRKAETHQSETEELEKWAVLDVPLLLEGGLDAVCDFLIFIDAPDELRAERACQRHGWALEEWEHRELAQASLSHKKARADVILTNSGDVHSLREQLATLLPVLRALQARPLSERWPTPGEPPIRRES